MKWFGLIFCGFGLVFMAVGASMAWTQDARIRHSRPVEATVLSTDIEQHTSTDSDGHTSTSYRPVVRFRYSVDGREYTADHVHPLDQSAGHAWAQSVVQRFEPGAAVGAFTDGAAPSRAFLLREYTFLPYVFVLFPMLFVGIGVGVACSGRPTAAEPLPLPTANGWFEVRPAHNLTSRRRTWLGVFLACSAFGMLVCGHYFVVARPHYETMAYVVSGLYAVLVVAALAAAVYVWLLARHVTDAEVFIDTARLARGAQVTVGARQRALKALTVEEAHVGLVCKRTSKTTSGSKTTYSTADCYEDDVRTLERREIAAGQELEHAAKMAVPQEASPSSPSGFKGYPRYAWSLRLRVKLAHGPDYRASFPVIVE